MTGTNGLRPVENLAERRKCPIHPTKARFSEEEATEEGRLRSARTKLNIVPYLCEGCGYWHLTKNSHGTVGHGGKYSVGEFKVMAPDHPVFSGEEEETDDEGMPVVPGDFDTRVRFARAYLQDHPEPTSAELCAELGECSKDSLRKVMHALGYVNTRGRSARWVYGRTVEEDINVPVIDRATGIEVENPSEEDVSRETPEPMAYLTPPPPLSDIRYTPPTTPRTVEVERLRHIPLGDLLDSYAAAGFRVVLTLEERDA